VRLILAVAFAAAGCGDGPATTADPDAAAGDADAMIGLPSTCGGDCAALELTAIFGATSRGFDRAFFGLTAPDRTTSGAWEIHLEATAGGADGCPTQSSPTPDRTLVVAALLVPPAPPEPPPGPVAPTVSLLDFEGALLPDSPVATASRATASWVAADPCVACAEGESDRADRFVAFELSATFADGSVAGHVFASHCASLDDL
jgi:hypothetical protein